jgi:hypothetical protein
MKKLMLSALLVSTAAFAQGNSDKAAKPAAPAADKAAKPATPDKDAKATPPGQEKKDAAAPAAAPQMPTMPAEGKRWVESFFGNWKSKDVVMTMNGQTMNGTMKNNCKKGANGWAAVCEAKMEFKKGPTMEAVFVHGWDIGSSMATFYEVTSMAEVHAHKGKWTDDKTITVTHSGKNAMGQEESDQLTFTLVGPKEIKVTGSGNAQGKETFSFTGTFTK